MSLAFGDKFGSSLRANVLTCGALIVLMSGCDPSFTPDWHLPSLNLADGATEDPGPSWPIDAGFDAGELDAGELDAGGAVDADVDTGLPVDAVITVLSPFSCAVYACPAPDAGPNCRICTAPCKEVPCQQGTPCRTEGACYVTCDLCMVPPIK